jgi:hypothetical protein
MTPSRPGEGTSGGTGDAALLRLLDERAGTATRQGRRGRARNPARATIRRPMRRKRGDQQPARERGRYERLTAGALERGPPPKRESHWVALGPSVALNPRPPRSCTGGAVDERSERVEGEPRLPRRSGRRVAANFGGRGRAVGHLDVEERRVGRCGCLHVVVSGVPRRAALTSGKEMRRYLTRAGVDPRQPVRILAPRVDRAHAARDGRSQARLT